MPNDSKLHLTSPVAILLAGVVIAVAIVYANQRPAAAVADDASAHGLPASANVPAPRTDEHIVGSTDAPVVLIEYSDFQCPFCARVHPTLKRIVEESDGQVAWVLRNFPLESIHPQARPAAAAAECIAALAGNDAFWKYADAVFGNQQRLGPAYARELALQFGASATAYDACIAQDTYDAKISADVGDAIANGGQGTPFTVVWSKNYQAPLSGALPYEQFKAVISSVQARQ